VAQRNAHKPRSRRRKCALSVTGARVTRQGVDAPHYSAKMRLAWLQWVTSVRSRRKRFLDVGHRRCNVVSSRSGVKRLICAKPRSSTRSRLSSPWGRCWTLREPHWLVQSPSSVLSVPPRQDGRLCCSQWRQGRWAGCRLTTSSSVHTSTAHHTDGCVLLAAVAGGHSATRCQRV